MDAKTPSLANHLARQVRTLHPAYFAMSMATGIVSIAGRSLGLTALSGVLFWVNVIAYCALWVVTLARLAFYTKDFLADWSSHQRGPGFFTTVAATSVLGVQLVLLRGDHTAGVILWWFGLALWAICTYAVFVALSVKEKKPSLEDGINGGWLLAVVATQSICVLGCNVIDQLPSLRCFIGCAWASHPLKSPTRCTVSAVTTAVSTVTETLSEPLIAVFLINLRLHCATPPRRT